MSRKLTKNQKVALHRLADNYSVMSLLAFALSDDEAHGWYGYGDNPIWSNASEGLAIHKNEDGTLYVRVGEKCEPEVRYNIEDPILIDLLNQLAPKPKAKKKPTAKKGKKFRVWFQVMGRFTDSNNIGYAIIQAKDEEQAIEFAKQDLMTKKKFTNVEVVCRGRNEEFDLDEEEQDEDEPLYCYDVDWEADGRHGRYYARSGPYAKDEDEATQFGRDDVTMKNGFMGFETELEAEEEL